MTFVSYPGPVADAYRAIDVFAHLSHADSSPFAIHEGMSAGKPSVISALPGNRELVTEGETGLLVPPGDPEAAADAFLPLVKDSALAASLGAGAGPLRATAPARGHGEVAPRPLPPAARGPQVTVQRAHGRARRG